MAKLNRELLLELAQGEEINSKKELAQEVKISRQHLYRLLKGENIGLDCMIKISRRFPNQEERLFF